MRPRWVDFTIALSLLGITIIGILALWGDNLRELFNGENKDKDRTVTVPVQAPPPAPAGPAQGPF